MIVAPDSMILYNVNYTPLLYLFLVLFIVFNGFSKFSFDIQQLDYRKQTILKFADIIGWIYIPIVLLLLYNDFIVLRNVNLSTYRNDANYYETGLFVGGKVLSLFIYISELSFIPHFLFFYVLRFEEVKKSLKIRLLIASFSFAFMTLLFAGREGIVYWTLNTFIYLLIFRKSYSEETKKNIKKRGLILLALIATPFLAISFARFSIQSRGSFASKISPFLEYFGQGPHIFSQAYYVSRSDIKGYDFNTLSSDDVQNLQLYLGWTFGTFVKTFVWQYGKIGTVFLALIFNLICRLVCKMHRIKRDIWSFFIIIMLFQIPYWGVFYYRYSLNQIELVYSIFTIVCLFVYSSYSSVKQLNK